jgi:hypothetical protein
MCLSVSPKWRLPKSPAQVTLIDARPGEFPCVAGPGGFPTTCGKVPWGHHRTRLDRVDTAHVREWYAGQAIEFGWSRAALEHLVVSFPEQVPDRLCAARRWCRARRCRRLGGNARSGARRNRRTDVSRREGLGRHRARGTSGATAIGGVMAGVTVDAGGLIAFDRNGRRVIVLLAASSPQIPMTSCCLIAPSG